MLGTAPAYAGGGGGGGGSSSSSYTCKGGDIPSGTYKNVAISGPCTVAAGSVITISR